MANPRHFLLTLATPKSTKNFVLTSPSKWHARKCQIPSCTCLVLAFKKGLQNHIKCRVPSKRLKFEKWSKGIKGLVFKLFSLAKLIFWIVAIFVEQWRKQVFTYGKVDFWCLLQYRQNGRVNFGFFFFQLSHIDRETRR